MILVVLSTHAELASTTAQGRSYWETGELAETIYLTYDISEKEGNNKHDTALITSYRILRPGSSRGHISEGHMPEVLGII